MSAFCKGCAGDGVGHHISTRERQVIEAHTPMRFTRKRECFARIVTVAGADSWATDEALEPFDFPSTAERAGNPSVFHGPLAHVAAHVRQRLADGWISDGDEAFIGMLLTRDWACRWCYGTGRPQLSVHALETANAG